VALEMAMYRAYHRWMADYCGAYQNRLGGVILAGARDIDGALAEIRGWGHASWAWGLVVYAPVGMPLDHPSLEPLYAEAAELDLAVVLHTFTVMPPMRLADRTPGTICGSSALRLTPGAEYATWRR
jgi:predicted TIM-barrel fold metal-dependent hydrolase